jgi:hypothetical protein
MNRLVLNVATGAYVAGQQRLKRALSDPSMCWADQMPPGSPTHKRTPYAFKAFAVEAAARQTGAKLILWADACILPIRSMEPLWDLIEKQGYWFSRNGFPNGQWCSDASLPLLGITREEAFRQEHVVATTFGLNLASEVGATFASEYLRLAQNGSFRGPWKNENGEASADPRVTGHRHDQSAASVIAARLGMVLTDPPAWFAYRGGETPETVLVADAEY